MKRSDRRSTIRGALTTGGAARVAPAVPPGARGDAPATARLEFTAFAGPLLPAGTRFDAARSGLAGWNA